MKKDKTPPLLKFIRWAYPKVEAVVPKIAHRFAVRLFFTPFRYPVPEKEKKALKFAQLFSIEVSNISLQCYSWGSGDKIVLLVHGWSGRATQFRRFIKPLINEGYKVIGFDGPAHGNSGGKITSLLEFELAMQKLYALKGEPKAIIAHSFGGNAVLYSAMKGLPVTKLINIASPTIGDDIVDTFSKAINATSATKDYFYKHIEEKYGMPFSKFTGLNFVARLPKPIRLLLIHDENDKEVGIKHPLELLKVYPSAELFKTSGLGHTRILKDDVVIKKCVTFVTDSPST